MRAPTADACAPCKLGEQPNLYTLLCDPCPRGRFGSRAGICESCPVGRFSAAYGLVGACTPCGPGKYGAPDAVGETLEDSACASCSNLNLPERGKLFSAVTGANTSAVCAYCSGEQGNMRVNQGGIKCDPCPEGHWCDGSETVKQCLGRRRSGRWRGFDIVHDFAQNR